MFVIGNSLLGAGDSGIGFFVIGVPRVQRVVIFYIIHPAGK
jgi:hypothetical protein